VKHEVMQFSWVRLNIML